MRTIAVLQMDVCELQELNFHMEFISASPQMGSDVALIQRVICYLEVEVFWPEES